MSSERSRRPILGACNVLLVIIRSATPRMFPAVARSGDRIRFSRCGVRQLRQWLIQDGPGVVLPAWPDGCPEQQVGSATLVCAAAVVRAGVVRCGVTLGFNHMAPGAPGTKTVSPNLRCGRRARIARLEVGIPDAPQSWSRGDRVSQEV